MKDASYNEIILNRMEIEEVGFNPEKLARAVHKQLNPSAGTVPLSNIAAALDIVDIRYEPLSTFEGALVMPADRNRGAILVNNLASEARQRFTIAHELGHYLNLGHKPNNGTGFECTKNQMKLWRVLSTQTQDQRQELEANRFAIELLAPKARFVSSLRNRPNLSHVLSLAQELNLSREATARRFVDLHDDPIAIVFSKDNRCRYAVKSNSSSNIRLRQGLQMPELPAWDGPANPTGFVDADPEDWTFNAREAEVEIQTFWQQDGYCMTLVLFSKTLQDGSEDDDGIEDTFERFVQFQGR